VFQQNWLDRAVPGKDADEFFAAVAAEAEDADRRFHGSILDFSAILLAGVPGMNHYVKYGLLSTAVVGTLAWLAYGGIKDGQTYFKTIPELGKMGDQAHSKRLRVSGYVLPGSIAHHGDAVHFTIVENEGTEDTGAHLDVVYRGVDPLPDTFKEHAQALADGKLDANNVFQANKIQAKCASKYEAKPNIPNPAIARPTGSI
jgi:cytochrome c-type biogenesis protein CcmE